MVETAPSWAGILARSICLFVMVGIKAVVHAPLLSYIPSPGVFLKLPQKARKGHFQGLVSHFL